MWFYDVTGFVPAGNVYNLFSFSYGWNDVIDFVPTDSVYAWPLLQLWLYDVTGFVPTYR